MKEQSSTELKKTKQITQKTKQKNVKNKNKKKQKLLVKGKNI